MGFYQRVICSAALLYFVTIPLLPLFLCNSALAADTDNLIPKKGGNLAAINLQIPKDPTEKGYLGLSGSGHFGIPQIKANGVFITIFNLYCPICQSTISAMAEIYRQIEDNPDLRGRLKLIAIGAGNSPSEIKVFKENYNVPFPIFPDEDFKIHQALGEVKTPFFIAVRIEGDRPPLIVQTHLGGLINTSAISDLMIEAYGMKREDFLTKKATSSLSLKDSRLGAGLR